MASLRILQICMMYTLSQRTIEIQTFPGTSFGYRAYQPIEKACFVKNTLRYLLNWPNLIGFCKVSQTFANDGDMLEPVKCSESSIL